MRYLLARMPFSFLLLAAWLGFEGYRRMSERQEGTPTGKPALYLLAAFACLCLSMLAFRERHRPRDDGNDSAE